MKVRTLALIALATLAAAACTTDSPTAPAASKQPRLGTGFMGGG